MSILGINKQLDLLQTLAVLTIRGIEIENGWSESGQLEFQTAFVVLVVMLALLVFIGLLWRIHKFLSDQINPLEIIEINIKRGLV